MNSPVPSIAPVIVSVVPELAISRTESFLNVAERSVDAEPPVYLYVPPSNIQLSASFVDIPSAEATPPFAMESNSIVPPWFTTLPV